MLTYKNIDWTEVLASGQADLIEGMANSMASRKSRNKANKKLVAECDKVLNAISDWQEQNGIKSNNTRGIYDQVSDLSTLSDADLNGMYESLYSRRWYYEKTSNKTKLDQILSKLDEVKAEKAKRNKASVLG